MSVLTNNFVIGGSPAVMHSKPYMISLQKQRVINDAHYCGGALITAGKAISAAHCYQIPSIVTAVAGAHNAKGNC